MTPENDPAELIHLRNRITALEANGAELLAKGEHLSAENERLEKCVVAEYQRQISYLADDVERAEAELAELRTTMMGDSRERIEQVQADMDALSEEERVRREAANAPLLRIQLAHFVSESQRLKEELARTSQAAAKEIWAKLGLNTILDWSQRAEAAEASIERAQALHARNANTGDCEYCSMRDYPDYAVPWPCDTVRALAAPETPGSKS